MSRRSRLFALLLAAGAAPLFAADTYTIDKAHSDASFRIRHFATKVRGRFSHSRERSRPTRLSRRSPRSPSRSSPLRSTRTTPDRDKHLQSPDFFDASKCPDITFTSTKITPAGKDKYEVAGTLTMRCVAKPVTLPVTFLGFAKDPGGNERASFEVVTKLNRKDFGINWNKTLDAGGVMLSDDVDVEINLETVKKKPEAATAR